MSSKRKSMLKSLSKILNNRFGLNHQYLFVIEIINDLYDGTGVFNVIEEEDMIEYIKHCRLVVDEHLIPIVNDNTIYDSELFDLIDDLSMMKDFVYI